MATVAHQKAHEAIALLEAGRRDDAARALELAIRDGPRTGAFWKSVATLADRIGEIDVAVEASRRFSRTEPMLLSRYLHYWGELTKYGREAEALGEVERMPTAIQEHYTVLHFRGQIAAQSGDFDRARDLYRRAIALDGLSALSWFALSAITDASKQPQLLDEMLAVESRIGPGEPMALGRFQYALGRAYHDLGDYRAAMRHYTIGAELRRSEESYDRDHMRRQTDGLIADFTPETMRQLTAPSVRYGGSIFVNGLPRSGTTLMQQILTSHERVSDGGELGLLAAALIPTGDFSMAGASRYQQNAGAGADPWGRIAYQYGRMLKMRFRTDRIVVDKTLAQSHIMGLLLHALPDCPVVWMRRSPSDVALSCFRNYFSGSLPWSWALGDIGHFMAIEDRLFAHWTGHFPDRILVVPYEELVGDPAIWIARICRHVGLDHQEQLEHFYLSKRVVKTASLQQVRRPIATDRIGLSDSYLPWMGEFWSTYEAG